MKWILKKLIVVLVEALVVMGLLDALGLDLEGILGELFPEDEAATEETTAPEATTEA